jgi:hypothetical protein
MAFWEIVCGGLSTFPHSWHYVPLEKPIGNIMTTLWAWFAQAPESGLGNFHPTKERAAISIQARKDAVSPFQSSSSSSSEVKKLESWVGNRSENDIIDISE